MPLIKYRRYRPNHAAVMVPAPGGASFTTWNPSDKAAAITLSGGDLVMTNNTGSAFAAVRSTTSHSSGKYYFENTFTTQNFASFSGFGIESASASLTAEPHGSTLGVSARGNGNVDFNGGTLGPWTGAGVSGSITACAVDLTALKIWFWESTSGQWNSDILANQNPATGTGGYSIATLSGSPWFAVSYNWQLNDVQTANFGATAYVGSPPSGFGNW